MLVTRRGSASTLPLGLSKDDGLVNVMRRKSSTSFVTVMDEEFHFPTSIIPDVNIPETNWADAYVSTRQLVKKSSTDGLFTNVLFKSNSDSPQFSPTPPPSSPMFRRSSVVMITRSTSCPDLRAKSDSPPPIITRLPSWDDVREQFNHAHAVAVHSGLGEDVVIRERSAFLSAWTLHSLSSTFRLNQSA